MSLVALASVKGSPGVTTTAVALAACWPEHRSVAVAEVDPAGGDLAARFGLAEEPGLVSWAAAARRTSAMQELSHHLQQLPGGVPVLVAPPGSEQASAALRLLEARAPLGLSAYPDGDVLADLGRVGLGQPLHPLIDEADLLVVSVRPVLADLAHLAARIEILRNEAPVVVLVLVGSGPYPPKEVASTFGVEVPAELPIDVQGAAFCSGARVAAPRAAVRSPLLRAARSLALELTARLGASVTTRLDTKEEAGGQDQAAPVLERTP